MQFPENMSYVKETGSATMAQSFHEKSNDMSTAIQCQKSLQEGKSFTNSKSSK